MIRYVVTHINKDGMRTLVGPAQGRNTHETEKEAEVRISLILANNDLDMLKSTYGFPLEVRPVEVYPGHFDPKGIYFD